MFFIWGVNTKAIHESPVELQCSHCGHPELSVKTFQKFFRVYFVPLIPMAKSQFVVCPECGTHFQMIEDEPTLEALPKVRTPWWGYSGVLIIVFVIFLGLIAPSPPPPIPVENIKVDDVVVLKNKEDSEYPYTLLKITKVDDKAVSFVVGIYGYQTEYQAQKHVRASKKSVFDETSEEVSREEFKKLPIESINRN